jgi:c-di-GMP-binding flagellar brake protein YcgR
MVPGMGVEFTDVNDAQKREIESFVDRLRKERDDV